MISADFVELSESHSNTTAGRQSISENVFETFRQAVGHFSIKHLHLSDHENKILDLDARNSLGDLCDAVKAGDLNHNIGARFSVLFNTFDGESLDWFAYWEAINFDFTQPFLTSRELDSIQGRAGFIPITQAWYGSQVDIFLKNGFHTIGDLIAGLRTGLNLKGFGPKKRQHLLRSLVGIAKDIRTTGSFHIASDASSAASFSLPVLPTSCHELDISFLRLGIKERVLREAKINTISDVLQFEVRDLLSMKRFGKATLTKLSASLERLSKACDEGGSIDWEIYYGDDITPFPKHPISSEDQLIASLMDLPDMIIHSVKRRQKNGYIFKTIFKERIYPLQQDKATLDRISKMTVPRITRERVRQIEADLLENLNSTLLGNEQAIEGVHVEESFKAHLRAYHQKLLAGSLETGTPSGQGDMEANDRKRIDALVLSIGQKSINSSAHHTVSEDMAVFSQIGAPICDLPITALNLGAQCNPLHKKGIFTLLDVRHLAENGGSRSLTPNLRFSLRDECEKIIASLVDGRVSWKTYAQETSAPYVEFYIDGLAESCMTLLKNAPSRVFAQTVFSERAAKWPDDRPTTNQIAEVHNTYGSSIKRIETDSLLFLQQSIFERDHARLGAILSDDYIQFWRDVKKLLIDNKYHMSDFTSEMEQRGFTPSEIQAALPTVVAVLTGFPLYSWTEEPLKLHPKSPLKSTA